MHRTALILSLAFALLGCTRKDISATSSSSIDAAVDAGLLSMSDRMRAAQDDVKFGTPFETGKKQLISALGPPAHVTRDQAVWNAVEPGSCSELTLTRGRQVGPEDSLVGWSRVYEMDQSDYSKCVAAAKTK